MLFYLDHQIISKKNEGFIMKTRNQLKDVLSEAPSAMEERLQTIQSVFSGKLNNGHILESVT